MREFRKNNESFYICEECGSAFKYKKGLCKHINVKHSGAKNYYDKFIKSENEDLCKICKEPTKFMSFKYGYDNCCSTKCKNKYRHLKIEESNLKNFGVKNSYEREEVKQTCKKTLMKNYGVEHALQSSEIMEKNKNTRLKRYNDINYTNTTKRKQTCLQKYGVNNVFQHKDFQEKYKKTIMKNYGVENPQHNLEIFEKGQKTRFKLHKYLDTNINYRGSYELDFLEKYYNKIIIKNAPIIKYELNEKHKYYYPDFFIPSLNLVVEIKNSYLYNKDKDQIIAKEKATIASGFQYIIIIDKNYIPFEFLLQ